MLVMSALAFGSGLAAWALHFDRAKQVPSAQHVKNTHCISQRSKCQHDTSKIHIAFHNEANVSTTRQKYTLHFTSLRFTECAMLKSKKKHLNDMASITRISITEFNKAFCEML